MMGWEDFGIQPTRRFILGWATNYHYLMRLWMPCPLISTWMESYGEWYMVSHSVFMWCTVHSGLVVTISKKPWRYLIGQIRSRSIGLGSNTWYSISLIILAPTKNDTFASVIFYFPPPHMPPPLSLATPLVFFFPTGEYVEKNPCRYIDIAVKQECKDMKHLEKVFQDIVDKGGEGVILRDPLAPLQPGRCPGFLKHKVRLI